MRDRIQGIYTNGRWLPLLLVRMVVGVLFVRIGLDKIHHLEQSRDTLHYWGIAIPVAHRWDSFFPFIELICGALILPGFLTRFSAALLFGILVAAILDTKLKELTGFNLVALQEWSVIALLVVLCAVGAGSASLDRFIFKNMLPKKTK